MDGDMYPLISGWTDMDGDGIPHDQKMMILIEFDGAVHNSMKVEHDELILIGIDVSIILQDLIGVVRTE
ncbi:hypothetical protein CVS40_7883 [Lucilia cuprina]|nr:hypothetical protein CVS40_7883 [Lucilia cuprina]